MVEMKLWGRNFEKLSFDCILHYLYGRTIINACFYSKLHQFRALTYQRPVSELNQLYL